MTGFNVLAVPYVISLLVATAGVVALLTVLMRLGAANRRLSEMVQLSRSHFATRTGILAARLAALRAALDERRRSNRDGSRPASAA